MMEKEIFFGDELREKLMEGVKIAYDAVKHSFGLHARHTLMHTNDKIAATDNGYKTLSDFSLAERVPNASITLIKSAIETMQKKHSDGTTLTVILIYHLYKEILKAISSGKDPILIKQSLDAALSRVLQKLERMKKSILFENDLYYVALAAANGDEVVAENLAKAFHQAGKEGIITIETSKTGLFSMQVALGVKIDQGAASSYFLDEKEGDELVFEDVKIFITSEKISSPQEIMTVLHEAALLGKPLLIIADDYAGETLSTLVINKMKGVLPSIAIRAPFSGEKKLTFMQDLANATLATLIAEEKGISLKYASSKHLGFAKKVVVKKEATEIVLDGDKNNHLLQKPALTIYVGGETELEINHLKEKYTHCLSIMKSALDEGILPGGGSSLLFLLEDLTFSSEEKIGADILKKPLLAPFAALVENLGIDASSTIKEVLKYGFPFGFNLKTQKVEDLLQAKIIDPYKVVEDAIKHSVHTATLLSLTEVLLLDQRDQKNDKS